MVFLSSRFYLSAVFCNLCFYGICISSACNDVNWFSVKQQNKDFQHFYKELNYGMTLKAQVWSKSVSQIIIGPQTKGVMVIATTHIYIDKYGTYERSKKINHRMPRSKKTEIQSSFLLSSIQTTGTSFTTSLCSYKSYADSSHKNVRQKQSYTEYHRCTVRQTFTRVKIMPQNNQSDMAHVHVSKTVKILLNVLHVFFPEYLLGVHSD